MTPPDAAMAFTRTFDEEASEIFTLGTSSPYTPVVYSSIPASAWVEPALSRLDEIAAYPEGWDSYGSSKVTDQALQMARRVIDEFGNQAPALDEPHIAPVSGGGMQFEWADSGRELELEILPDGNLQYLLVERTAEGREREQEGELPTQSLPDFRRRVTSWLKFGL